MIRGNGDRFHRLRFKSLRTRVKVDRDRTVINLIRNGKRRVVVIDRADEPSIVRNQYLTAVDHNRVIVPHRRRYVNQPFILSGHFQNRKHFREIIFHAGDIHFVKDDDVRIAIEVRAVNRAQEVGFGIFLRKFVEITVKLRTFTPSGLDGNDG